MSDIEFREELPIWEAEGVKPPQSKIDEGWKVGDRPPAEWWNWFQNRTYKSLEELRSIAFQLQVDIDEVPSTFHDLPANSIRESNIPREFEFGISFSTTTMKGNFPSINKEGTSITLKGNNKNFIQLFITNSGDIWSRRSTELAAWNISWYNVKQDLDTKVSKETIGALNSLLTTDRSNIVNAINSVVQGLRDDKDRALRVQVSNTIPTAEDGRIYYNTEQKLFYVGRDGQWYRMFVSGDAKLEQQAPVTRPTLVSKTDTTVTLKAEDNASYRYEGGAWQDEPYFSGLQRNAAYKFQYRFNETEIYKASDASPSLSVTTDKGTQTAPSRPNIRNLEHDRVTVEGAANTEVSIDRQNWYSSPHTFTNLTEETEYTAYARKKETDTHKASPASEGTKFTTPSDLPGPSTIIIGDENEGYYGVVPASQLITGNALASKMNVTQGTSQHSDTPWHKFSWKGKTLFVAQKTIRHSISWDHLNSKDVVYGNKTIEVDGVKYKVRLIRGALTDPSKYSDSDRGAKGSEWNRLVAPLHIQRKDNSWDYPAYMENDLKDWKTYLSDTELVIKSGNGFRTWCQEVGGDGSQYRVYRGHDGVSFSDTNASSNSNSSYGWRPVLEVV